MNLSQKEIGQRFESFQQKIGIADIIESKSLLNMVKIADNEKLLMPHEKILFVTIAPEMKVLSVIGHFESLSSEEHNKMKEKTLFLFELFDSDSFFFELEGDYSRFNGEYINSSSTADNIANELSLLVYETDGEVKVTKLSKPTKDWTHFVKCGFIP